MHKRLWFFICVVFAVFDAYGASDDGDKLEVLTPSAISCTPVSQYIKCARLPCESEVTDGLASYNSSPISGVAYAISDGVALDDTNWTHYRDYTLITGTGVITSKSSFPVGASAIRYMISVDCTTASPFVVTFTVYYTGYTEQTAAQICATRLDTTSATQILEAPLYDDAIALDGDICPDGFYTMASETWCDDGMVNTANIPMCTDDTSGEYCLMEPVVPCALGVSQIKTSTGLSFTLYAEKYTTPSLAIGYDDGVCYAKLELGQTSDSINIEYNGNTYHVIN